MRCEGVQALLATDVPQGKLAIMAGCGKIVFTPRIPINGTYPGTDSFEHLSSVGSTWWRTTIRDQAT